MINNSHVAFAPARFLFGHIHALLVTEVAAGVEMPEAEVLSLAAAAEAIYLTATLESRELERIADHHKIWLKVFRLFDELTQAWANIEPDEESIEWLRGRLPAFAGFGSDRVEMFSISEKERLKHVKARDSSIETFGTRNDAMPNQSGPQHIYSMGHL